MRLLEQKLPKSHTLYLILRQYNNLCIFWFVFQPVYAAHNFYNLIHLFYALPIMLSSYVNTISCRNVN